MKKAAFMSLHNDLASVWGHLLLRNHVPVVLREIIGQHALQSASQENGTHTDKCFHEIVIWIRLIYDLQRCYLTGYTIGTSEIPPQIASCLLPVDLLFSSILYLIGIKTRTFPSQTTLMTKEFVRRRLILAQTVLSGLRLMLCHKSFLNGNEKRRLQSTIDGAWKDDNLGGAECCIVQLVFAAMIDILNEVDHLDAYHVERENARLPMILTGLYPLDVRPELCVTPLIHALAEAEDDWIHAYCLLYDTIWSAECALTQRYLDLRRHYGTNTLDPSLVENDEIIEQLYHQRSSLIISAFHFKGAVVPSNGIMESLVITLLDWDTSLDSFVSRQDSILQRRMSLPPSVSKVPNYGKHVAEIRPYLEVAMRSFTIWLTERKAITVSNSSITTQLSPTPSQIRDWVDKIASPDAALYSKPLEGPDLPVYIVDCPKLHAIPKKYIVYQLRWSDKWAFESMQEDAPLVNWKEGVQCPSCASSQKIKCARLIEPLRKPSREFQRTQEEQNPSPYLGQSTHSNTMASSSVASYSITDVNSTDHSSLEHDRGIGLATTISQTRSDPGTSQHTQAQLPNYTETPISPIEISSQPQFIRPYGSNIPDPPVSPLADSFNIQLPMSVSSRLSMNLPIPVHTPSSADFLQEDITTRSAQFEAGRARPDLPSGASTWAAESSTKLKLSSRSARIASSMRRRPSAKDKGTTTLPKDLAFVFSSSGNSLLLWDKAGSNVTRFDIPINPASNTRGCRYSIEGVEAVAAGEKKCAIITTTDTFRRRLVVFNGMETECESELEFEVSGRCHGVCIAVSKDDKNVAVSTCDKIELFSLDGSLQRMVFDQKTDVYELHGALSHPASSPTSATHPSSKGLTSRLSDDEHQPAIVSHRLNFSPDSHRLISATQFDNHEVSINVWDMSRRPVTSISERPRTFKLPPWVLNDGDLTSIFFDPLRRCALVTAFVGKEYPLLIPFPGYAALHNETYSTKIICAAQSPSGSTVVVANAMTEIILFEYSSRGTLNPRKLKKVSHKIPHGVFRPGAMEMCMPREDLLRMFWVRDGKFVVRSVWLGGREEVRDGDLRGEYERVAREVRVGIAELDGCGV
ncbi:hypothetical protein BDU57DRAFT_547277 [Ampelomyces quisqualis]|uniref:WD40-repeat-containing domain protein n=1 Tax=Ampelomyces quisqualis TaxID=50730 RepID=A0A6A5QTK3_AMPQU|nr:hypothetical protein BDU57DRAFT_547277 [Ampelomyces quisqualis]